MHYKYCPECGTKLIDKVAGDDGDVPYCEHCQRYWFDGFASCIIVLVYDEFDELVVSRQNYLSTKYSTFTAGYIKPGENAEETAYREVQEELGIVLDNLEYAGTYWYPENQLLMHGFIAYKEKCKIVTSIEVDKADWVDYKLVPGRLFPDKPGNAAWGIYRHFLKKRNFTMM